MKVENSMNAGNANNIGNLPSGRAVTDNGRAKTSARGNVAINTAWFAPGLSHALDLPYKVRPSDMGSGKRVPLGIGTNGSSRSGLGRIRLSPYQSRACESDYWRAASAPNTAKGPIAIVPTAVGVPGDLKLIL
jgi:hypothetical protein